MTVRMSNARLRPAFFSSENRSPRQVRSLSSGRVLKYGKSRTSRVDRVFGVRAAWEALTWQHIGVLVVTHQDLTGSAEVEGEVLRLTVGTHNGFVPADAIVILRRDTP